MTGVGIWIVVYLCPVRPRLMRIALQRFSVWLVDATKKNARDDDNAV